MVINHWRCRAPPGSLMGSSTAPRVLLPFVADYDIADYELPFVADFDIPAECLLFTKDCSVRQPVKRLGVVDDYLDYVAQPLLQHIGVVDDILQRLLQVFVVERLELDIPTKAPLESSDMLVHVPHPRFQCPELFY